VAHQHPQEPAPTAGPASPASGPRDDPHEDLADAIRRAGDTGTRPGRRTGARAVLDAVLDGVLVVDGAGRIVFANQAGESLFGYQRHDLVGRQVEILVPPHARHQHPGHRCDYAADPRPRPMGTGPQLHGARRDGSTFPAEVSLCPVPATGRSLTAAVVRDLTPRLDQEQTRRESEGLRAALQASDARFRLAFEHSSIGMLMISARPDTLGTLTDVNHAFADLLGRAPEDVIGQNAIDIFLPQNVQSSLDTRQNTFQHMLQGKITSMHDVVRRVVHADGHDLWVAITSTLIRDADGDPDHFFLSQVLNVTERHRSRIETRQRAERDRRIALMLQESLHDAAHADRRPQVGHLQFATRFLPARDLAVVGGDWHDVFALPDGRIGITIGDVAGHGIESAATMSRLRYATRMLATTGAGPAEVITRLNRVMLDPDRPSPDIEIATIVHAQLDPATAAMTYCSAGHPPMINLPGGDHPHTGPRTAWPIPALGGPPIGVLQGLTYTEHHITLTPGDLLIGYTDGLIERRDRSLDENLLTLLTNLTTLPPHTLTDVEAVADQVLHLAPPAGGTDDTAVLVLAIPHHPARTPPTRAGHPPPNTADAAPRATPANPAPQRATCPPRRHDARHS
jgi:PAS domain S-box-containing protein